MLKYKKVLLIAVFVCLCFLGIYTTKNKALPVFEYPLSKDTIINAIEDNHFFDNNITVKQETLPNFLKGKTQHTLLSNDKMVASIATSKLNGQRFIGVSLPLFYNENALPLENSKDIIKLATILFGGFNSSAQVYDNFIKEYKQTNTKTTEFDVSASHTPPSYSREGEHRWRAEINGITCEITTVQPKLDSKEDYIFSIAFATDWDSFHTPNPT